MGMHQKEPSINFLERKSSLPIYITKTMNKSNTIVIISLILLHLCFKSSTTSDTITIHKPIRDGDLLISKAQNFALGFFSPGKSSFRYVGIWYYNLSEQTIVWVANRNNPINDTSGVLSIDQQGNLVLNHNLSNGSNIPMWSTNVSVIRTPSSEVIGRISDLGNLVLTQDDSERSSVIWESFDHPTDTYLPYAKLGVNKRTGRIYALQSWKTEDDPEPGSFTLGFNTSGKAQMFLFKNNLPWWRAGSYNGEIFVGIPFMKRALATTYNISVVDNDNEFMFFFYPFDKSVITRVVAHQSGFFQTFTWDHQMKQWNRYWSAPQVNCDNYGTCGSNSECNPLDYEDFQCSCLPGFEPKNPNEWYQSRDASEGCERKKGSLICGNGEGFVKVENVKIPDTSMAIAEMGLSLEECESECLRNCSCVAYAAADVRNGGSGCLAWYGTLMDAQKLSDLGQDLFVRVDAVDLANYARKSKGAFSKQRIVAISVASLAAIALLIALWVYCLWKRKRKDIMTQQQLNQDSPTEEEQGQNREQSNLPIFSIKTILAATNNFSSENELGQGGFGSVYKGLLDNGQEIAVKRLSKGSGQGAHEFKNEIRLIAKLQHRNLVRLLGCSIHKEERMLIYEYLPNKSLDFFLYDISQRSLLDWDKRFQIIFGIARGVLYLHQDSRLKIIHRDLKASNVLLDAAMNPKISDFGMARIFGEDQIQARTRRVVGTYGYMSPEYAMDGRYSTKSDVFSFGVLILEIISGKRNTDRELARQSVNLIGHVWNLWKEGKALEIVDSTLDQSFPSDVVLRCIQIGLLCVQESALDRPSMLEVVFMLGNEISLPSPQKPAFLYTSHKDFSESSTSGGGEASINELTTTTLIAR